MIEHLVWFKLKPETTEAQKDAMLQTLRDLPAQMEVIRELACGRDFSGRAQGFEIGLRVLFADQAGLEIYGPHPAHKAFGDSFRPLWDSVMALDFETE